LETKYVIGVDIGTTSTKSVLYEKNGKVLFNSAVEYPLHSPTPETAEQNPEEIFQAVIKTVGNVMKQADIKAEDVLCVSFSSAMHSLIAMDKEGKPLTECITWADNRSSDWTNKIKNEMDGHEIYRQTGTPIHPMSPLSKLVWLKN
jgi:gluconokinase